MSHLTAVALPSGVVTIGLGWSQLGARVLVLAPLVASLSTLACAVLLSRRESPAAAGRRIRDIRAGSPEVDDRRAGPVDLCRRRA
ncbi:hypothetical protein [Methylobacterium radiodurans]|uniref:Uncharacterized protein n=1 Tax=Methylobacterium radiodurans TaxID=2202828 RepID=A0A2U8VMD3_9HYPH|nr:hypothetical protein [Methylobacterium radiodurans]AWN34700.1 hypothetical protein DK427_02230 [Methylobacterium radiodurans]